MHRRVISVLAVCVLVVGGCVAGGCAATGSRGKRLAHRPVAVVGAFAGGESAWPGAGMGLGSALARQLVQHERFDVQFNPGVAHQFGLAVRLPAPERAGAMAELRERSPEVTHVVLGRITDFGHVSELPGASRTSRSLASLFGGDRDEAIVAIEMTVLDVVSDRIVFVDHVVGQAKAPDVPPSTLYAGVEFGSYAFWNAPLGVAAERAVDGAAEVFDEVPVHSAGR